MKEIDFDSLVSAKIAGRRDGLHIAAHQLEMAAAAFMEEPTTYEDRTIAEVLREQATLLRGLAERKVQ